MTNLERWRIYCQDLESDDLYIDWTFYAMISAALQRRVCLNQIPHVATPQSRPLFPNVYVIFIGPPGAGKSSAGGVAKGMFESFGGFEALDQHHKRIIKVAPSSLTVEQLYKHLNNNYSLFKLPESYHSAKDAAGKVITSYISSPIAFFATEELASLFRENTSDLVNFISEGYDCGDFHRETKTNGVDFVKNMCVMLFGCATPEWIKEVSGNGLLKQGFAARTIFIWSEAKRHLRMFWKFDRPEQQEAWNALRTHVKSLTQLYGPAQFTDEANDWLRNWYESGGEVPTGNKAKCLTDYYTRKKVHLIKMSMIVHYADNLTHSITVESCKKALAVLDRAEMNMHKALLGSATENPAAKIAQLIEDKLVNGSIASGESTHFVKEGALLLHVYEHCTNGRATFDDAIKYLLDTGRIVQGMNTGKIAYKATKEIQS